MEADTVTLYTIGHSTRSLEEFTTLLSGAGVDLCVDVRTVPRSRTNPQFNRNTLPESLAPYGIGYQHEAALGGLRGKSRTVPPETNGMWRNASFHNFADYALSSEFRAGLEHLIGLAREHRCAIACSEAVWWRCHRRIIADYLIARGHTVLHVMGTAAPTPASLTPGAVVRQDATVVYPAA